MIPSPGNRGLGRRGATLGYLVAELALLLVSRPSLRASWLREALVPPEGLTVQAVDGLVYTGIVVLLENRPVAVLAMRDPPLSSPRAFGPPAAPPAPLTQPSPRAPSPRANPGRRRPASSDVESAPEPLF